MRGFLAQPSCSPDVGLTEVGVWTSSSLRGAVRRTRGTVNFVSHLMISPVQSHGLYIFESLVNLLLCHTMVLDLLFPRQNTARPDTAKCRDARTVAKP